MTGCTGIKTKESRLDKKFEDFDKSFSRINYEDKSDAKISARKITAT